jgi:aspartate/methionine/tyrosine aminotransferase
VIVGNFCILGVRKDVPWPGSRCGWIEVYNSDKDANFKGFIDIVLLTKMLEVCSTTLPQIVLPHLYEHPKFKPYLQARSDKYQRRADEACAFFAKIPQVRVNKPKGVFYLVVELFDLPINTIESVNKKVRLYLDELENESTPADFQFAYELMGAEGICVVPLTGFGSQVIGFRMTLLQEDDAIFTQTLEKIGRAISKYYL